MERQPIIGCFPIFLYFSNVISPLVMPYFEIKTYICGVKYDTNIKKSTLI